MYPITAVGKGHLLERSRNTGSDSTQTTQPLDYMRGHAAETFSLLWHAGIIDEHGNSKAVYILPRLQQSEYIAFHKDLSETFSYEFEGKISKRSCTYFLFHLNQEWQGKKFGIVSIKVIEDYVPYFLFVKTQYGRRVFAELGVDSKELQAINLSPVFERPRIKFQIEFSNIVDANDLQSVLVDCISLISKLFIFITDREQIMKFLKIQITDKGYDCYGTISLPLLPFDLVISSQKIAPFFTRNSLYLSIRPTSRDLFFDSVVSSFYFSPAQSLIHHSIGFIQTPDISTVDERAFLYFIDALTLGGSSAQTGDIPLEPNLYERFESIWFLSAFQSNQNPLEIIKTLLQQWDIENPCPPKKKVFFLFNFCQFLRGHFSDETIETIFNTYVNRSCLKGKQSDEIFLSLILSHKIPFLLLVDFLHIAIFFVYMAQGKRDEQFSVNVGTRDYKQPILIFRIGQYSISFPHSIFEALDSLERQASTVKNSQHELFELLRPFSSDSTKFLEESTLQKWHIDLSVLKRRLEHLSLNEIPFLSYLGLILYFACKQESIDLPEPQESDFRKKVIKQLFIKGRDSQAIAFSLWQSELKVRNDQQFNLELISFLLDQPEWAVRVLRSLKLTESEHTLDDKILILDTIEKWSPFIVEKNEYIQLRLEIVRIVLKLLETIHPFSSSENIQKTIETIFNYILVDSKQYDFNYRKRLLIQISERNLHLHDCIELRNLYISTLAEWKVGEKVKYLKVFENADQLKYLQNEAAVEAEFTFIQRLKEQQAFTHVLERLPNLLPYWDKIEPEKKELLVTELLEHKDVQLVDKFTAIDQVCEKDPRIAQTIYDAVISICLQALHTKTERVLAAWLEKTKFFKLHSKKNQRFEAMFMSLIKQLLIKKNKHLIAPLIQNYHSYLNPGIWNCLLRFEIGATKKLEFINTLLYHNDSANAHIYNDILDVCYLALNEQWQILLRWFDQTSLLNQLDEPRQKEFQKLFDTFLTKALNSSRTQKEEEKLVALVIRYHQFFHLQRCREILTDMMKKNSVLVVPTFLFLDKVSRLIKKDSEQLLSIYEEVSNFLVNALDKSKKELYHCFIMNGTHIHNFYLTHTTLERKLNLLNMLLNGCLMLEEMTDAAVIERCEQIYKKLNECFDEIFAKTQSKINLYLINKASINVLMSYFYLFSDDSKKGEDFIKQNLAFTESVYSTTYVNKCVDLIAVCRPPRYIKALDLLIPFSFINNVSLQNIHFDSVLDCLITNKNKKRLLWAAKVWQQSVLQTEWATKFPNSWEYCNALILELSAYFNKDQGMDDAKTAVATLLFHYSTLNVPITREFAVLALDFYAKNLPYCSSKNKEPYEKCLKPCALFLLNNPLQFARDANEKFPKEFFDSFTDFLIFIAIPDINVGLKMIKLYWNVLSTLHNREFMNQENHFDLKLKVLSLLFRFANSAVNLKKPESHIKELMTEIHFYLDNFSEDPKIQQQMKNVIPFMFQTYTSLCVRVITIPNLDEGFKRIRLYWNILSKLLNTGSLDRDDYFDLKRSIFTQLIDFANEELESKKMEHHAKELLPEIHFYLESLIRDENIQKQIRNLMRDLFLSYDSLLAKVEAGKNPLKK